MNAKLPGLNGLRAIAASLVLVGHVYQIAGMYGDTDADIRYVKHHLLRTDMVNLFFVISGFIITYILCKERNATGTISLRNFYIKRFLRIWPLYFGIIIVVVALTHFTNVYDQFPAINSTALFLLCAFLITLAPLFNNVQSSVLPHYWSLSVEEQFYILWPPLFKLLKGKALLIFPLVVTAGIMLLRNIGAFYYSSTHNINLYNILSVLNHSMFGSISIGVMGAFLIEQKHAVLPVIFKPVIQIICWLILLLSIFFSFFIPYIHYEAMSIIYLILILNVTSNPKTLIRLEYKFLDKAGTISYGIYMYHWILIPILIVGIKKMGWWGYFIETDQRLLLLISYVLTYFIAWLSYRYFESYFLKLKPAQRYALKKAKVEQVG